MHQGLNAVTVWSPNGLLRHTKDTSTGYVTYWAHIERGNALSVEFVNRRTGAPLHIARFYLLRENDVSMSGCR